MVELIYVSTAIKPYSRAELDHLLSRCVDVNSRYGVTGMLLYAGGSFMQIIEGDPTDIDYVYERIVQDPTHTDIFLMAHRPIQQRSFASWHMGFRRLGDEDVKMHPAYAPFFEHGFDARSIGARPGLALEMLTDFARNQRADPVV